MSFTTSPASTTSGVTRLLGPPGDVSGLVIRPEGNVLYNEEVIVMFDPDGVAAPGVTPRRVGGIVGHDCRDAGRYILLIPVCGWYPPK